MSHQVDQPKEMIMWVDSDPNIYGEIIKQQGYEFKFFTETKDCIVYYKSNGTHQRIVGIITSMMERNGRKEKGLMNGPNMIYTIRSLAPCMLVIPQFAICSVSVDKHDAAQIISSSREHIQRELIKSIKNQIDAPKQECKVEDCNDNHSSHHCRLCGKDDTNHRAMNCPDGTVLYHGTKGSLFTEIIHKSTGELRCSKGGRLGEGIYFTTTLQYASAIGKHWNPTNDQNGVCVIKCRVNLGKMKDYGYAGDGNGKWRNEHNSCYGKHPEWLCFGAGFLEEYCVKCPSQTRICEVILIDCNLETDLSDIFAPRLPIKLINSSIKGRVHRNIGSIIECKDDTIQPIEDGYYFIYNENSCKVLDILNCSKDVGAKLIQFDHHGGDNQRFYVKYNRDKNLYTMQCKHSNLYLELENECKDNGAKICQGIFCEGKTSQMFGIIKLYDTICLIYTHSNGKVFDVRNSSQHNCQELIQWEKHCGRNQCFRFTKCE